MKNQKLKDLVFYEIYPTSFFDSNGDGIGDLKGIESHLEHVKNLGANAIWLNPFYVSPFKDGGYDVEDFYNVDPRFGTLEDFDHLLNRAHELGIKIIIDLVAGHVSEKNKMFLESAKPTKNEYSDMFIWNNSVWDLEIPYRLIAGRYDRHACYMVNFFSTQPALNFGFKDITHPSWQISYKDERTFKARDFIVSVCDFWLSRGVDGFRVDMADSLVKNDDEKVATIEVWNYMFDKIRSKHKDAIFVSEWCHPERSLKAGFDSDFVLDHWDNCAHFFARANESTIKKPCSLNGGPLDDFIKDYKLRVKQAKDNNGYLSFISGNHDTPRVATNLDDERLRLFYLFLLTTPGIPFIYYGDEIGMKHAYIDSKDGGYQRTGDRTPMQWNKEINAGFSSNEETYLPTNLVNDNNVEDQINDKYSLYNYIKELIAFRKNSPSLQSEEFDVFEKDRILYIIRGDLKVIMNLSNNDYFINEESVVFGEKSSTLKPNKGVIIKA